MSEHLFLAKNKSRLTGRQKKNSNGDGDDASEQSPIIRNDLRSNRRHNKNDKNAYRDYSKRCEEVLFYQNNCAMRCAQEAAKPLNTEKNDNNNVKKTDDEAAQKTCVKSCVKNVCDNAASNECCDRNCELAHESQIFLFLFHVDFDNNALGVWNKDDGKKINVFKMIPIEYGISNLNL